MTANTNRIGVGAGGNGLQTSTASNGFTPVQNAILNVLKTATTLAGYSGTEVCKQVKQFSENQVK
jgi:hypothetical protein